MAKITDGNVGYQCSSPNNCSERVRVEGSECDGCFSKRIRESKSEVELRKILEDHKTKIEGV